MRSSLISALVTLGLLAGCSMNAITDRIQPYRIDIRQGNYVDQAMMAQLQKGMTRDQVRFVLGTPLVTDAFHADRWDYVYRFTKGHGEPEQRLVSVFFVEGRLDRIEGDVQAGDPATAVAQQGERSRVIEISAPAAKD